MNSEDSKKALDNSINGSNMIDKTRDGGLGHTSSTAHPVPPKPEPAKDKK